MNDVRISSVGDHDARHYAFVRNSGARAEDFASKSERIGEVFLSLVMSGVAVFIVLGLVFGWFG